MLLISSLRPLLQGAASVKITLSNQSGSLVALVEPNMLDFDPHTSDPERAALQKALARPLKITLSVDGNPDEELADALRQMHTARASNLSALEVFVEAQAEASNRATLERGKKAAAAPGKHPAGTTKKADGDAAVPQPVPDLEAASDVAADSAGDGSGSPESSESKSTSVFSD